MRRFGLLSAALLALAVGLANAETRTFIVASAPDAYGIDHCLATGARCGVSAADAYCESRSFKRSQSFRRVDPAELTAAIGTDTPPGPHEALVAIECTR